MRSSSLLLTVVMWSCTPPAQPDGGQPSDASVGVFDASVPDASIPDTSTPDGSIPDASIPGCASACDVHATCVQLPGGATCECQTGFSGNGLTCVDVDECAVARGGCARAELCVNNVGAAPTCIPPLPYPPRPAMRLKGIQPDGWPVPAEISGNNTGFIVSGLLWVVWEGAEQAPPCTSAQAEYEGHCFNIDQQADATIAEYSSRGLDVVGVLYGVPEFARIPTPPCSPAAVGADGGSIGLEIFCVSQQVTGFARFAGMLASRYDGRHGHGRISDFVIHNEVNHNDWYDVGCGQGTPCDVDAWVAKYAADWSAASDAITTEQPTARVLLPLTHDFGTSFDLPAVNQPSISVKTFLTKFAAAVGGRKWGVAYHPYAIDLTSAAVSADDLPSVTFGNLGVLIGWLRMTFPNMPSAWDVELTESGIHSLGPGSSPQQQAQGVCDSFRNVLGTPGISVYIYHRMKDHPLEGGLALGLHELDGGAKPAWTTWAMANRDDLQPAQLSCGFEDLPFVRLTRSSSASRGHWTSTRIPPAGFTAELSWRLWREAQPGTVMLFECAVGPTGTGHNLITTDVNCEGLQPMGPVGFAATASSGSLVPLYRCRAGTDHFVSGSATCEGQVVEGLLGYVEP